MTDLMNIIRLGERGRFCNVDVQMPNQQFQRIYLGSNVGVGC
ncbi:MAG: hypothetical protein R2847_11800 [Bacteroidia bacterium]